MTKIPDDVVERANKARIDALFKAAEACDTVEYLRSKHVQLHILRAAGEVFVAWEREQCAKIAEGEKFGWSNFYQRFLYCRWPWRKEGSSTTHSNESVLADEIAAAIRARSAPEKE